MTDAGPVPLPRLSLRIMFGGAMIGPGKIALLTHIRDTGSIAAAGRVMGMSYKRAWSLVEEMNAAFRDPLVTSARGGPGGGGAQVTAAGLAVMAQYHAVLRAAATGGAAELAGLATMLRDMSDGKERLPDTPASGDMSDKT